LTVAAPEPTRRLRDGFPTVQITLFSIIQAFARAAVRRVVGAWGTPGSPAQPGSTGCGPVYLTVKGAAR
jgi:hypothetical protein